MSGLLGLSQNINTTENAMRELSVLERMDQRLQQDKQNEMLAQQQQAMMYEQAYAAADQLLEKDRIRINKRIALSQRQVRDHLRSYGGSKQQFMEDGGLATLSNLTSDIIRSPEAIRYAENKKNLAKIWEAQEKGLGHLLSPKDLKSVEDYENNEDGAEISYSGLLAEVELPPAQAFDYGTNIPFEKIMSYKGNRMRIIGNMQSVHPDWEITPANVKAFMAEMGYGGVGTNTTKIQLSARQQAAKAKAAKTDPKNEEKHTVLGNYEYMKKQIDNIYSNGGLTLENIQTNTPDGMIETVKKKGSNPTVNKLLANKSNIISRKKSLSEKGFDSTDIIDPNDSGLFDWSFGKVAGSIFNDMYGLKESYEFLPLAKSQVANRIYGDTENGGQGYTIENNTIKDYVPTTNTYRMDGVQMSGKNELDPEDHRANYEIVNMVTGLKGSDIDGNPMLLMNAYNDDGTLDEKATAKIDEGYKGQNGGDELKFTTLMALRNAETGDIYYEEIDTSQPHIRQALANAMPDNDITEQVQEENNMLAYDEAISSMQQEEKIKFEKSKQILNDEVFTNKNFELEGQEFYGAGSAGQQNRYDMMKSFYAATNYVKGLYTRNDDYPNGVAEIFPDQINSSIDRYDFTRAAEIGDITKDLKTYDGGISQQAIVNKWLQNVNADLEPGSIGLQRNTEIARRWLQFLSVY